MIKNYFFSLSFKGGNSFLLRKQLCFFPAFFICSLFSLLLAKNILSQPIPPFKMTLSDDRIFSASELPKGKPVVLIYFDPDCDHCQKLMKELFDINFK